jgi:DNA processing protein
LTVPPVRLLERGAPDWPACLAHLGSGEPKRLFVRGPLALNAASAAPSVAMVGARAPSAAGERFARTLARELAEAGVSIISGLALGIDAASHAGALDGRGRTVAVLGCGIDRDYPRRNAALAARIAASGVIASEWGPGVEPAPWRFPVRNRIVAALAQATVVVEATRRSGALITADHALAIGRDVLAVPGAPWLELGGGTLALLRAGAAPVGSAGDVLDALGVQMAVEPARLEPPAGVAGVLWSELRRRPRRRDALALATGLGADITSAALAELELDGLVVEERDGTLSALEPSHRRPVNSSGEGA